MGFTMVKLAEVDHFFFWGGFFFPPTPFGATRAITGLKDDDCLGLFGLCYVKDMHSIRSKKVGIAKPLGSSFAYNKWEAQRNRLKLGISSAMIPPK